MKESMRMKGPVNGRGGFTLIELLIVIAIMGLVLALVGPAFSSLQTSGRLTKTASDIQGTLDLARSYAMANNAFVYAGFRECDGIATTNKDGIGRLVVAVVATRDGTRAGTNESGQFVSNVIAVSKAMTYDNVHLAVPGETAVGGMAGRPSGETVMQLGAVTTSASFTWPPPGGTAHTFVKVIEFDPRGVARLQTRVPFDASIGDYTEIFLIPAKGNVPLLNSPNQAAVQIDGVTGVTRLYRP
jgi:prepilin-type N-terminal cleavage/methylation domain-containing protein